MKKALFMDAEEDGVLPRHRVVRSTGSLGGFALGLDSKRKLLALENSHR
ncbi:MAG: MGMT family protein [Deltaproteobacteria bacterium]|nr:MAG: MGMT family protein [Deltaproteobacteria bacterium]